MKIRASLVKDLAPGSDVTQLHTLWRRTQTELSKIVLELDDADQNDAQTRSQLEEQEQKILLVEEAVVEKIQRICSNSLNEVYYKLQIWRTSTSPFKEFDHKHDPKTQLALAAVDELIDFCSAPEPQGDNLKDHEGFISEQPINLRESD